MCKEKRTCRIFTPFNGQKCCCSTKDEPGIIEFKKEDLGMYHYTCKKCGAEWTVEERFR